MRKRWSIVALLLAAGTLRADTVHVGSAGGNPLVISNVKVTRIEGGTLFFRTPQGGDTQRELTQVSKIVIDDEPAFNAAEEAYAAGEWDTATSNYQKTVRSTAKPWLADFCSLRLIDAASKSGRFDAAVTGYIAAVVKDPAMADARKPALPDGKSTYLETAVTEINAALADNRLQDVQRQALLSFLLEIHRARQDTKAAGETAEKLLKLSADGAGGDPLAGRALADLKLGLAHVALDQKDYAKAIEAIEANSALFVEPDQQADALYCLAEARYGAASASKDPKALRDAALAYMRVVAHFKDRSDAPFVPESLLKTARILDELKETQDARELYEQVAAQFADSPAAAQAKKALERASNSGGGQ